MYAVHLMLIGKLLVDFLLVVMNFFRYVLRLQALRTNIDWKWPFLKAGWVRLAQNFSRRGHSPPTILLVGKLG